MPSGNRPLKNVRPIGPFISTKWDDVPGSGKKVIGVAGTPFPNRPKNPLVITYVLQKGRMTMLQEAQKNIQMKVDSRYDGINIKVHRSGVDSATPFKNQAVSATIKPKNLPLEDDVIHRIEGIIERYSKYDNDIEVGSIIIDQE